MRLNGQKRCRPDKDKRSARPRRNNRRSRPAGTLPFPVAERLPLYLRHMQELDAMGGVHADSNAIACALGLTPSTVRQDFSHLPIRGAPKRGYNIRQMERALAGKVGIDSEKPAIVVGAGNLGRTLTLRTDLRRYGFLVRAIVDVDPAIIGARVGSLTVEDMSDLADIARTRDIEIGILAVPSSSAQSAANMLILAGVRGILNLTFARVVAPRRVFVVNDAVISSLLTLSWAMNRRRNATTARA